jgi:hypothetical protein
MSKERSRHAALKDRRRRRWNRGDLTILLCGVLAFLAMTFGTPLVHQMQMSASGDSAGIGSPAPATVSRQPAQLAGTAAEATGAARLGEASAPAGPAVPPPAPVLPAAAEPVRIRYGAAAFDVSVHALDLDAAAQASQTVEPPETKDGYWLTPFGTPGQGSANTTYVIGHSWEGADAPFNHLSSSAAVGDRFEVDTATGTIPYRVDSVTTYLKSSLKDSPIWDIVPNRLVLISCFTEDPWGKNVVVTASPAP